MSDTLTNSEIEFSKLAEEWKKNHESADYDPVPFLTSCAKIFETELIEFHKGDPDPFDERHPEYTQPGCTFGKLLVALSKTNNLIEKLTSTYIRPYSDSQNVTPVTVASARLLLAASPGLELQTICKEKEWLTRLLLEWTVNANEPLRTYATGLLVGTIEPQRASNEEYIKLISILLKRLWNYVRPGKYPESEYGFSSTENSQHNLGQCNHSESAIPCVPGSQKRKHPSDSKIPAPKKISIDKPTVSIRKLKFDRTVDSDLSFAEDLYDNDLSNSSWSEQMPAMLGCNYSLESPLSSSVCQRFILDFLKGLGEYQDLLSIFLELKALDLINVYLKEKKSDGLLTFKALEFLASLLCHNKVAMEFIELNGIQNLLIVQRPSMGSTGVSLCLYYLAYRKDAMEKVCQLPGKVLSEMVKYAIWLLDCSHETGCSQAALFFSISFSFRVILNLFDRMNGLRCLMNMISTSKPFINSLDKTYDPDEDSNRHFIRQTTRTVCAALKKYFEAHLQSRVSKLSMEQKLFAKSKESNVPVEAVSKYQPMVCSREQFFEYLEILGDLPEDGPNGVKCLNNWPPVLTFHRLDGVQLMNKVIDIACDWTSFAGQIEVVRYALDVLAVVTLCRVPQMLLTKRYAVDKNLTGISIMLAIVRGGTFFAADGETQKSALAVISNCVSGEQDATPKADHGTPKCKKQKKGKETLWKHVQYSNGIDVLLSLLGATQPAHHADELRYLACKALLGLSDYKPVAQIMSKLPFFVNGQIQSVAKEPVLNDKKRIHLKFCKCMEALLEKVSGKPISLDLDLDAIRKSHIVSETHMQYDNKDVLLMIHNHLVWSKLHNAADALAKEAELFSSKYPNDSVFVTPRSKNGGTLSRTSADRRGYNDGSGDATTPRSSRRISFTRGHHASGETPTPLSVINIASPLLQRKVSLLKNGIASAYAQSNGQNRFQLSSNGVVSVKPKCVNILSQKLPSPPTLNSIIEGNFKHQHAKCRNPVVTVPEFSVFTPHCCPEPRYKVEASSNFMVRSYHRQGIRPQWGGIGGFSCDLQLVYSRYKPGYVIKGTEDRKIPFCSVAFIPGDEQIILGDYQGDVVIHSLYSDEDQVIQGVASSPIISLEPSRDRESILVMGETLWTTSCSLHTFRDQIEHKVTFDGVDYVEFSKLLQDKVIGTKGHKAIVFDANSGQVMETYEREDLSSYYKDNRATFSPDDKLILCDGLLWDVRKSHRTPIHKFDKFNDNISGIFHPGGIEVIINTEVWDLRNYHLLHTVPALGQCSINFNSNGTIIYAVRKKMTTFPEEEESDANKALMSAFRTFDATDYKQLAFIAVRHQIYDLALDSFDRNVAVIETYSTDELYRDPAMSVCRFYKVGMSRGDEEEEEESNFDEHSTDGSSGSSDDDASSSADGDDDDGLMDILNGALPDSESISDASSVADDEDDGSSRDGWEMTDESDSS